jgi:integrase
MRLPHYLTLAPSGVFHFRFRLPAALRETLGRREVRLSLGTRDTHTAQVSALALAQRYAQMSTAQGQDMPTRDEIIAQALAAAAAGRLLHKYKIDLPGINIEANNAREHREVVEMLQSLPRALAPAAAAPTPPAQSLTLREASRRWENSLGPDVPAKTRMQMRGAVRDLCGAVGSSREMGTVARPDLAAWFALMRQRGLKTPTLANRQSYAKRFFDWCSASGYYAGDNPATGHIRYGRGEKRAHATGRNAWRALTVAEVQRLYRPDVLVRLSQPARWGALIGLYTGARVSEVAQLRALDVLTDGVPRFRITDEGAAQHLKNAASAREVPIHPDLLALGILERLAEAQRAAGLRRQLLLTADAPRAKVNGAGDWLSKAFGRLLKVHGGLGGSDEERRLGFHSLRKTVVQELQQRGVTAEVRAAIVGHDLASEHHQKYSTISPLDQRLAALQTLTYGLDLTALRPLLHEPA